MEDRSFKPILHTFSPSAVICCKGNLNFRRKDALLRKAMVINMNEDRKPVVLSHTVEGYKHTSKGRPGEDSSGCYPDVDQNQRCDDYQIAVIADGHGDPSCFRSKRGSTFSVQAAMTCLQAFADSYKTDLERLDRIMKDPTETAKMMKRLGDSIVCEWQKLVGEDLKPNRSMDGRGGYEFSDADPEEVGAMLDVYRRGQHLPHIYGTTLMAALHIGHYLILLHQGDGHCAVIYADGSVKHPIPWDERCYQNVTTSMCEDDAAVVLARRYHIIDLEKEPVAACYLGSDGVEDSYRDEEGMFVFYKELSCKIDDLKYTVSDIRDFLEENLTDLSRTGSTDDVSVGAILFPRILCGLLDDFQKDCKRYALEDQRQQWEQKKASMERKHGILEQRAEEVKKKKAESVSNIPRITRDKKAKEDEIEETKRKIADLSSKIAATERDQATIQKKIDELNVELAKLQSPGRLQTSAAQENIYLQPSKSTQSPSKPITPPTTPSPAPMPASDSKLTSSGSADSQAKPSFTRPVPNPVAMPKPIVPEGAYRNAGGEEFPYSRNPAWEDAFAPEQNRAAIENDVTDLITRTEFPAPNDAAAPATSDAKSNAVGETSRSVGDVSASSAAEAGSASSQENAPADSGAHLENSADAPKKQAPVGEEITGDPDVQNDDREDQPANPEEQTVAAKDQTGDPNAQTGDFVSNDAPSPVSGESYADQAEGQSPALGESVQSTLPESIQETQEQRCERLADQVGVLLKETAEVCKQLEDEGEPGRLAIKKKLDPEASSAPESTQTVGLVKLFNDMAGFFNKVRKPETAAPTGGVTTGGAPTGVDKAGKAGRERAKLERQKAELEKKLPELKRRETDLKAEKRRLTDAYDKAEAEFRALDEELRLHTTQSKQDVTQSPAHIEYEEYHKQYVDVQRKIDELKKQISELEKR